jgi:Uri superfamily endonuclease
MRLGRPAVLEVGCLGRLRFEAGWYLYTGSARGPGGLAGRLGRHFREDRRIHWHVDHLRERARLFEAWFATGDGACEHRWASVLAGMRGVAIAAPRFGASDCRCAGHLFHAGSRPARAGFARRLRRLYPGSPPVRSTGVG